MNKENIYMITEETYEATVNERILLYGMIRQMAFLTKRAETMEDFFHLKETAAIFGSQAEELFETWDIPGRYVVYGDPGDLDGIKELELLDYGGDDPDEDVEDEERVSFFEQFHLPDNFQRFSNKSAHSLADYPYLQEASGTLLPKEPVQFPL